MSANLLKCWYLTTQTKLSFVLSDKIHNSRNQWVFLLWIHPYKIACHVCRWWNKPLIHTPSHQAKTNTCRGKNMANLSKKRIIAWRNHIIRINMAIHSDKWATSWQVCCYSPCVQRRMSILQKVRKRTLPNYFMSFQSLYFLSSFWKPCWWIDMHGCTMIPNREKKNMWRNINLMKQAKRVNATLVSQWNHLASDTY